MAEKPKTYPQKIQDLTEQLAAKDEELLDYRARVTLIPQLEAELQKLRDQLEVRTKQDQTGSVNIKSQMVDLEQRAVSAEQGIRNLTVENNRLKAENQSLEQQLDVAGTERDKNLGKDQKIQLLTEELQRANLSVARLNQQLRDITTQATEQVAKAEKESIRYKLAYEASSRKLNEMIAAIESMPDYLGSLRNLL